MANTYNSFEQYISENAALRQTLADTLTEKGVEASGKEGYATLVEKVGAIEAGTKLPTLSNPATAAEILSGYEAINDAGEVVTGTALETASTATAADIMSGKTAYNSAGELLTGAMTQGLKMTEYTFSPSFTPTSEYEHYKDFTYSVASGFRYVIIVATNLSSPAASEPNRAMGIRIGSTLYTGYTNGGVFVRSFSGTSLKIRLGINGYAGSYSATLKVYGFK